jgi:AmmeMemoRadiSam system protein A
MNIKESSPGDLSFTSDEKTSIFRIARESIRSVLNKQKLILSEEDLPRNLFRPLGAFVTLKINGKLRGCIGRFTSSDPLYKVIRMSALSSAFEDPRFTSLNYEEFCKVKIEITILGPLKKITSIDEIIIGKHGIYILKDKKSGTMLPQVAVEHGWTIEQFLGYTSRDKADLGWDGWRDADLSIFEGLVLKEN